MTAVVSLDSSGEARYPIGEDSLVEGDYDPKISRYTLWVGPPGGNARRIRVLAERLEDV